jgi:hypothetical protein
MLSSRDSWWTPAPLRERLLAEWDITLDAAACAQSRLVADYLGPDHVVPARRDALVRDWHALAEGGAVYLNGPYTPSLLRQFLAKAVETATQGTDVVGLVPASTDTRWWHDHVTSSGADVEFLQGRLRFGGPHATGGPAMFGSALLVWRGSRPSSA